MDDLEELEFLLEQFEKIAENVIGLRNVLNGRLNFPTSGIIIPHKLKDQYWHIATVLRSEFSK